jgi:hypothetical protein
MEKELYGPACVLMLMDSKKSIFDSKVRKRVHDFIRSNFSDKVESIVLDVLQATSRDTVSLSDLQLLLQGSNSPLSQNMLLSYQIDSLSIVTLLEMFNRIRGSYSYLYQDDVYRIIKRIYDYAVKDPADAVKLISNNSSIIEKIDFDMAPFPEQQLAVARLRCFIKKNKINHYSRYSVPQQTGLNVDPLNWNIDKCCSMCGDDDNYLYFLSNENLKYIRIIGEDRMMSHVITAVDKLESHHLISDKHFNEIVLNSLRFGLDRVAAYVMKRRDIKAITKLCKDLITDWRQEYTLKNPQDVLFSVAAKDLTTAARESLFESMQLISKGLDNMSVHNTSVDYNEILHKISWVETINKMLDMKRPEKVKIAKPKTPRKKIS